MKRRTWLLFDRAAFALYCACPVGLILALCLLAAGSLLFTAPVADDLVLGLFAAAQWIGGLAVLCAPLGFAAESIADRLLERASTQLR
jgi:hypothetical protein